MTIARNAKDAKKAKGVKGVKSPIPSAGPSTTARRTRAPGAGAPRPRLALVVAEFNGAVTGPMADLAATRARSLGYEPAPVLRVGGTWDLPFAVDAALSRPDVVGAVALGAVVTGETGHDVTITDATVKTLQELSLVHGKPVGLGVTGPRQTYAQAEARIDRAEAAVEAVHLALAAAREAAALPQRPPARGRRSS